MIMNRRIFFIFIIGISSLSVRAQERVFRLDELYTLAEQNNRSLKVSRAAYKTAEEAAKAARAQRLPDIDAQLAISYNGRGLITDRDFSHVMNVYIPEYGNSFVLKVSQVIYSGGALSNAVRIGDLGRQMAELDVEKNRQEVRFLIAGQYLDLYKSLNSVEILEQNIALAEEVLRQIRHRYEQGAALKNDITRYELQVERLRLQLAQAKDRYRILNHRLCVQTGLPDDVAIRPDTAVLHREVPKQDEPYWQRQAADNHYGLQQAALAKQISERKISLTRAASLPHLALVAENNLGGPITVEIPPLNKNLNYWYVGLGVQYSLSSLFKNNRSIRQAKYEAWKSNEAYEWAKEQVNMDVQAACTDIQTSLVDLRTQEKSVELAAENYGVVSNRYANGLALITDMTDASNMKIAAELQRADARINLIYNSCRLKYLTHEL